MLRLADWRLYVHLIPKTRIDSGGGRRHSRSSKDNRSKAEERVSFQRSPMPRPAPTLIPEKESKAYCLTPPWRKKALLAPIPNDPHTQDIVDAQANGVYKGPIGVGTWCLAY